MNLRATAYFLAALCAAGAAWLARTPDPARDDVRLVLVFDISQSMNVADMPASSVPADGVEGAAATRLSVALAAGRAVVDALPCGAQVGLGIFAEHRTLLTVEPVEVCGSRAGLLAAMGRMDSTMNWSGNSEISKGLSSGIRQLTGLKPHPTLVFFTDGQEAPPVNPRYRFRFEGEGGKVPVLLVGVGGDRPVAIPRTDPLGRPVGSWGPGDVMQKDVYAGSRSTSVGNDMLADVGNDRPADPRAVGTPGREHLSSLRRGYLELLAEETGGQFVVLQAPDALPPVVAGLTGIRLTDALSGPMRALALAALILALLGALASTGGNPSRRGNGG